MDLVAPALKPAEMCMPLSCPEGSPYEPMGICTLILKIALGSLAPFMPMLEVVLGLPGSILDIPGLPALAVDLPGLPWVPLADIPPIPILDFEVGSLELPAWDGLALGNLIFAILTIPLDIAIGLLSFDIPDLSFDGMLDLVLGAIAAGLDLPALMLPTLGLLDLAICIIALILLPIMLILAAIEPFLGDIAKEQKKDDNGDPMFDDNGDPILIGDIVIPSEEDMGANLTDAEKKAKGEEALNRLAAKEAAAERAARQEAADAQARAGIKSGHKHAGWKPGLGDDFYG